MEAATAVQGRTLVETTNTGWYLNADEPDGNRVRKTDNDRVITREEYAAMTDTNTEATVDEATTETAVQSSANIQDAEIAKANEKPKPAAAAKPAPKKGKTTTGKEIVGATVEIQCAWVDAEKRNKAQAKVFKDFFIGKVKAPQLFEKVSKAKGTDGGKPDGRKRTIKKQDAFQVAFHPDNVSKAKNERRRVQKAAKTAEAKKTAPAAAK